MCFAQNDWPDAIEDNSLLIEEAYNQEDGVIQHISNFIFMPGIHDKFAYVFTQEWPVWSVEHQLSYTVPYISNPDEANGVGDVLINYRYQLFYKEDWASISPRISLIIPFGNKDKGIGEGAYGVQMNIPVSKRWNASSITHFNLGGAYLFDYEDKSIKFKQDVINYFAGISYINLLHENFNLMMEMMAVVREVPQTNNAVRYENELIISPGFRSAINIGELQIVNAISIPMNYSSENNQITTGLFFYISFEHPI